MNVFRTIRNYIFYCGIEKDEYNAVKRDAYVSNFRVWRILHCMMVVLFAVLFISSLFSGLMQGNRPYYLFALVYSVAAAVCSFVLKEDSIAAQLVIYLSIIVLFLFGAFITSNKPANNATTFAVLLIITPMFMIDKPYFMAFVLCAASAVFAVWMRQVKVYEVWRSDLVNVITFAFVGGFLHIVANSIRIREFVLTRKINIQKDLDELTGLKNKDALTRAINEYLADRKTDKGLMLILDVDKFKSINDTYGHDVGDSVIRQLGAFLGSCFGEDEIVGRFGGDEFIVFLRDTDDLETAEKTAGRIVSGVSENVSLPDQARKVSVSIGIAACHGQEKHYSEVFKKADVALYRAKADPDKRFHMYE